MGKAGAEELCGKRGKWVRPELRSSVVEGVSGVRPELRSSVVEGVSGNKAGAEELCGRRSEWE